MVFVDSSVWVDYFNGAATPETDLLDTLLGREPLAIGDIVLTEVLQGFRDDTAFRTTRELLESLAVFELLGSERAVRAAENYRVLRKLGVTVRKTTDTIIATFCIEHGLPLLFADRDFEPFVVHLGLRRAESGVAPRGG